jgi:hypothetical protein
MKNRILDKIIEGRKGHYCHALEVNDTYEIESIVEGLIDELGEEYFESEYIEFFQSMSIYYLGDNEETEQEVYNFDFSDYIKGTFYLEQLTTKEK